MSDIDLERLVVFAIIMENEDGILGKSPDYIREKFTTVQKMQYPEVILDFINKKKFEEYKRRWIDGRRD